jgi:hypothetical protein
MRTRRIFKSLILASALLTSVHAAIPVQDMTPYSLGIAYCGMLRGQLITDQDIPSHELLQSFQLNYAPIPYVLLTAGVGVTRFTVNEYLGKSFTGRYGIAPSLGLALFTPAFAERVLKVTAGIGILYLNSADKYKNAYRGPVLDPNLGLIIMPNAIMNLELGLKGHFIAGSMINGRTGAISSSFSNRNVARGYVSFMLHSPSEGAYLSIDADASPEFTTEWSKGPYEASVGVSVGYFLKHEIPGNTKNFDTYFPDYDSLKARQDEMNDEIAK